jgi:hypothetical protein
MTSFILGTSDPLAEELRLRLTMSPAMNTARRR